MLEREPLERLAADGELRAFRHEGFWDCMDTYKDAVVLNDLWAAGERALARLGGDRGEPRGEARRWSPARHGFVGSWLARALLERGDDGRVARPARRDPPVRASTLLGIARRGRA